MFIVDANCLLNLLRHGAEYRRLPSSYRAFLLASRVRVRTCWHERHRYIPINPTFAAMELSTRDGQVDAARFHRYFSDFLARLYGINDVDPRWVDDCFALARNLVASFMPSLIAIVQEASRLMPPAEADERCMEVAAMELCDWLETQAESLAVVGGIPLYVAIYAIAGSPEARRILKVSKRDEPSAAQNVAWDFLYAVFRDLSYLHYQNQDDIFCTADDALAELLLAKIPVGPRYDPAMSSHTVAFESFGSLTPFPLRRLNEATRLSKCLDKRVYALLERVRLAPDVVAVGYPNAGQVHRA
jgi:hypothetical protein